MPVDDRPFSVAAPAELSRADRERRVRAVVAAARRIVDPADPLGIEARRALPGSTGLSLAGVELGLSHHVETTISRGELDRLIARAGAAPRVHVVLSANVFVGAVRALALAVAAAPEVAVRPSSREGILAPLLQHALLETNDGPRLDLRRSVDAAPGDHVHVYGRTETIAAIRAACPPGVTVRGHGPGFGIALLGGRPQMTRSDAERLSWDIVAFDQRGCLSPRFAFVQGSPGDAERFAAWLAEELELREREVPCGALSVDERRDRALYLRTMHAVGRCHEGSAYAVGVDVDPRALVLPPAGRTLHVARIADAADLGGLLSSYRRAVTCVGTDETSGFSSVIAALAPGARVVSLGAMQRPPLDGPVDLREML